MDQERWRAAVRQAWDQRAPTWDAGIRKDWEQGWRTGVIPFVRECLATLEGYGAGKLQVLDSGCGNGYLAIELATHAPAQQVTAADFSPEMLKVAQAQAEQAGVAAQIHFLNAGHDALPLPATSLDAIACITSLEFAPDPVAALREFRRVLRPSGWLIVGFLGALSPIRRHALTRYIGPEELPMTTMQPWELAAVAKASGWTIEKQRASAYLGNIDPEPFAERFAEAMESQGGNADSWRTRLLQCLAGIWLFGMRPAHEPA